MKYKKFNKKAFTIVELVIVIAVIAILAAILIPTFANVISNAKDATAKENAKNAYTQYLIDNAQSEILTDDFIYIEDENRIVAIKDGGVVDEIFSSNEEAMKAASGVQDISAYSLYPTNVNKLYAVIGEDVIDTGDVYAVGSSKIKDTETSVVVSAINNGLVFGTLEVPRNAIDDPSQPVSVVISSIDPETSIKVGEDQVAISYDIAVTNIKAENTAEITVTLKAPKGLTAGEDDKTIKVYHKTTEIDCIYDGVEGKVTFKTTSFSPYTLTYEMIEVTTLAELRYYLQRDISGNIRLGSDIVIDLNNTLGNGSDRETDNEGEGGVTSYEHSNGHISNYARAWKSKEQKYIYFGSRVRKDMTLDLNGYTITCYGDGEQTGGAFYYDRALFYVQSNSSLTIVDSSNTTGANGTGTIRMMNQMYAVWSVNDTSVAKIYDGIYMSDDYVGDNAGFVNDLVYSSGGEVNVYGGYFLYNTTASSRNGGFNVMDQITIPKIQIYEGVHLSKAEYRQNSGSDDDSIFLVGGCEIGEAEEGKVIGTSAGEVNTWYVVKGQNLQVKDELIPDKFLYRVGNSNSFALGAFFETYGDLTTVDLGDYAVRIVDILATEEYNDSNPYDTTDRNNYYGYIQDQYLSDFTFTVGDTWDASAIDLPDSFAGPVRLEIYNATTNAIYAEINLEVVDGKNVTTSMFAPNSTNKNVVLLNDIELTSNISVSGGYGLFGNGFTITDARTTTTLDTGVVNITNGVIDNIQIIGYQSSNAEAGIDEEGRAPIVSVNGDGGIFNSYIYGGKYAVKINTGTVLLERVTLDGGSNANAEIMGGNVTLKDCTTTVDTRGGSKGMGIAVTSTTAKIVLEGEFEQHNWLAQSDLPNSYSEILTAIYSDSTYAYTYEGTTYVNMGIFFFSTATNFPTTQAQTQLTDNTSNSYDYIENTYSSYTATCYTAYANMGSADLVGNAEFDIIGYGEIAPKYVFDFTEKNYTAKTDDSNEYCYFDDTANAVKISFETGGNKVWDTDILTVTKNGVELTSTVMMNGVDYTGQSIVFEESGTYIITYTYTDSRNYTANCVEYDKTYTHEITVDVRIVEPTATVYHPSFTYTDGSATTQVTANDKTYVMPDVSGTSDTIGTTTVDGVTIYYPIVTVGGSDSSGSGYSSGKIYLFCPAFGAVNIVDYDQDTGETLYTYNSGTQTWPHGISATTKVSAGEYYGYGSVKPYTGGSSATYEVCQYNSTYGLSFVTTELERNVDATTKLVEFYYVGTDGNTYYYYIQYSQSEVTYKSCITADTLITLADGTQKRVDELSGEELLLVWNLETGKLDSAPIMFIDSDESAEYEIVHLYFSDGTDVKVIYEHGFWDYDLNKYVYLDKNAAQYIGHTFAKQNGDTLAKVQLVDVVIETEVTEAYSPVTVGHLCYFVNGMLSMPGGVGGLFNIFEVDAETMTYDYEAMQKDIETYGLFTYEELNAIVSLSEEMFEAAGGQYLKISIGKGNMTMEELIAMINNYKGFI